MQKDLISTLIDVALDDNHLSKLRTVKVSDEEHLEDLFKLIKNYNYKILPKEILEKLYKKPGSEVCMEILYGTLGDGAEGYYEMEPKASIVAIRSRKKNSLALLKFSHDPWFEEEVAAAWANYRVEKYVSRRKSIRRICWYVGEKNLSLQLLLKKLGYVAQSKTDCPEEITFIKE